MAARQEEGWPLGLQPLTVRIGLGRTRDYFGSMSFNNTAMLTGSSTSSADSSSDLDTESTGSFFHDRRSITLGSLIGVSSILELSRRSIRGRIPEQLTTNNKKACKSKPWIFSLCSRDSIDIKNAITATNTTPSLGQYLAVERRAAYGPGPGPGPDDISMAQPNSLFVNGQIAPPRSSPLPVSQVDERGQSGVIQHANHGFGVPMLFSCICWQDTK